MTINLADFLNKEVTVTLQNGEIRTGIIKNSSSVLTSWLSETYQYYLDEGSSDGFLTWTSSGLRSVYQSCDEDILKITPKQMDTQQQLLQTIQETEDQLNKLKEQLKQQKPPTIQEAKVGDTLEDGSIVIKKENGLALVIAPRQTEVHNLEWSEDSPGAYCNLNIPSQWFIPSKEQLLLAYAVIPNEFTGFYWSSTVVDCCKPNFWGMNSRGVLFAEVGSYLGTVRTFRCISY
jgi:hypothetical protein